MITLSYCAIVKNEAQNLTRCLTSVKPHVDELVIVDTGSTDETIAIAEQFGAKVGHFEWCDDFAVARNYACSLVTGDWILTLDADEELEVLEKSWFTQFISETPNHIVALNIRLRDEENAVTEMQTPRLFRNLPSIQYQARYHEYLTYEGQPLSSDHPLVQPIEGLSIIHYGYVQESLAAKSQRRIPVLEKIRETDGLSLMLLWTLSGMYEVTQALEQAQGCYEEAWEILFPALLTGDLPQDTRSVRSWLYSLAIRSLKAEDIETSQFICEQGIQWFPDHPPLFYLSGFILKLSEAFIDSIPFFEHCLEANRTENYCKAEPFDQSLITTYPAFDLGTVYLALQQPEKAVAAFTLACAFDPDHVAAQEQLAIAQRMI